jgi:hypothetical protein
MHKKILICQCPGRAVTRSGLAVYRGYAEDSKSARPVTNNNMTKSIFSRK